jgi:hypothetical protein
MNYQEDDWSGDDNIDDGNETEDSEDDEVAHVPDEIVDVPDANGHTLEMVQRQLRDMGRELVYHTGPESDCTCFYTREVIHSTTLRTNGRVVTNFQQYASWQDWFEHCGTATHDVTYKDKRGATITDTHGIRFPNGYILSGGYYYKTLSDWLVLGNGLTLKPKPKEEVRPGPVAPRRRQPGF